MVFLKTTRFHFFDETWNSTYVSKSGMSHQKTGQLGSMIIQCGLILGATKQAVIDRFDCTIFLCCNSLSI